MFPGPKKHARPKGPKAMDSPQTSDSVQVFCRIRPLPVTSDRCVKRVDDQTVQLSPPLATVRNGMVKEMQYKFQYAFDEDASQRDVFEDVGLPLVGDLIQGKNGLLFTYGITSSGKTFTMQGRVDQPGILPRTLDVLFNSLQIVLAPRCTFKPDRANGFDVQSDMDAVVDRQKRDRENTKPGRLNRKKDADGEFAGRVVEDTVAGGVDADCVFSVFISYLEIYNNYAYDLLQPDVNEIGKPPVLQTKILRDDNAGHVYAVGATEIEVQSAEEALRLLSRGQKVRRVASTQLNADSSRSHAVFNIRLVQAPLDETGTRVVEDKDIVQISLLSLIDLAGSERTKRTKNDGDRLREAGNINSSLLTLRKCLDMLRANQRGENTGEIVPYRESKLTHLFKSYFDGDGKVRMVVCLNPAAEEYDETVHVLRFAESAQEIQVSRSQQVRFEQLGFTPGRRAAAEETKKRKALQEVFENVSEETTTRRVKQKSFLRDYELFLSFPSIKLTHHTDSLTLPALARFLEERIARHKALYAKLKAQDIEFSNRLRDLLADHRNLQQENGILRDDLEERNQRIADLEKELSEQVRIRKVLMHHSTLSEQAKVDLMGQLKDREYAVGQEQMKGHKIRSKLKGEAKESALRRECELEAQLQRTKDQYSQKNAEQKARLNRIRDIVDHAGDEVHLTPSAPFQPASSSSPIPQDQNREHPRARHIAPVGGQIAKSPFHNPRYALLNRRSSGKSGKYVDHRSQHRVPMGTHLQPGNNLRRRKSITKPDLQATMASSQYYLEHQLGDAAGHVETHIYKGDIIPTAGGGRSVIFRDKEVLRQADPLSLEDLRVSATTKCGGGWEESLTKEAIAERCAVGAVHYSPTKMPKSPSKPTRVS